jgi:phospholipase C
MTPEERLRQVKHIVVLMMENRSFDHMLGYLKTAGMDEVVGLDLTESNSDPEGGRHPVHAFHARDTKVQRKGEALQKRLDPSHSPESVAVQVSDHNGGFVKDYIATRTTDEGEPDPSFPRELWDVPMGYYTGDDLVTYDYLARTYCVCDAWHASIPGDTWPNRVYSVAGREAPSVWREWEVLRRVLGATGLGEVRNAPLYDGHAFTHQLADGDWRWYSHDPATLRAIDGAYRHPRDLKRSNFAWFNRKQMSLRTLLLEEKLVNLVSAASFLDDAVNGKLRKVSWIDPNFIDLAVLDPHSNDDHPPSDILAGQQLAFDVYDALRKSPGWNDTVLVITYDEHGGFYDHVPPPAVDDESRYKTLGLRVPALIVGPRVRQFVCHQAFDDEPWDHTALIRSILMAFAANPDAALKAMGGRVAERRAHLGLMLEENPRTDLPAEATDTKKRLREWRTAAREARLASARGEASAAPDGAGQPLVLTEFQEEWTAFAGVIREGLRLSGT